METARASIDAIDLALVQLLADRQRVVEQVLEYKRAEGVAARDDRREQTVMSSISAEAERVGLDPVVASLAFEAIIGAFRTWEERGLNENTKARPKPGT